jgi:hypothetical protein
MWRWYSWLRHCTTSRKVAGSMTEVEEEVDEDGDRGERQGREQQDNASNRHTGRGHRQGELALASTDTGGEGIECVVMVRVII